MIRVKSNASQIESVATYERAYPRFRVAALETLKTEVDDRFNFTSLICLGQGGCGFYSISRNRDLESQLQAGRLVRVNIRFQCPEAVNGEVEVQGNLIYCYPVRVNDRYAFYYGVEFIEPHRERMIELVNYLQELAVQGQISID